MTNETKARVIIADDSAMFRKVISMHIENLGYTVIATATDGQEIVNLAIKEKPNLIMLDINMPNKTGFEALEEIIEVLPETTVIMMTSVSDPEIVKKCIDLGAANYIIKNSSDEEISNTIRETWEMNKLFE